MKLPGRMLTEVLLHVFRKPATVKYPSVKIHMPKGFRGRLKFDPSKCICCKLCMKDCPTDAIVITKREEGIVECAIDLSRCIYCAQCVDSCPKDALEATPEFELAGLKRARLKVVFDGPGPKPAQPKPAPTPEKTA
jgi:formate hydrogenlyase subunit 6/NADH:ubiquinone oxidoreductase subunit I